MAGFRLIGALSAFWLVLEPGWLYLIRRVTVLQIMTVDSLERHYFFAFLSRLLLFAFLAAAVGFWLGNRVGQVVSRRPMTWWLRPFSLFAGWGWLVVTLGILLSGLLAAAQPGLKVDPNPAFQQTLAPDWLVGQALRRIHSRT